MTDDNQGTTAFVMEMGVLKRVRRTGWWHAGVRDPESIAEHSWRTSVIAAVLAMMEGADPAKAALLATFHDSQDPRRRHPAHRASVPHGILE